MVLGYTNIVIVCLCAVCLKREEWLNRQIGKVGIEKMQILPLKLKSNLIPRVFISTVCLSLSCYKLIRPDSL